MKRIINNIISIYHLTEDINAHEIFLTECYKDILFKLDKEEKAFTEQEYFISLEKDHKYLTIWFKYDGKEITITSTSKTLKEISLKEQYSLLYKGLEDILNERKKLNHSDNLNEVIDDNMLKTIEKNYLLERKLLK